MEWIDELFEDKPERIGAWEETVLIGIIETAPIDERERHYLIIEVKDGIGVERSKEIKNYLYPILNNPITHGRCYSQTDVVKELKQILKE